MTVDPALRSARPALDGVALPAGVTAVPFLAQVGLRLDPDDGELALRVAAALELALPLEPNTVHGDPDGRHVLWLGPDEWLVVGPAGSAGTIEAAAAAAAGDGFVTTVDLSANRTAIELAGPHARELLESGMPIDLHARVFGPGRCAQTLLSRVGVIVVACSDEPRYRLLVRPSFARFVADWLTDAAVGLPRG